MHKIRFSLGLCPRLRWGAYSATPDPLAVFKGREVSKGRGRSGGANGGEGKREGKGEGRKGRGGASPPPNILA